MSVLSPYRRVSTRRDTTEYISEHTYFSGKRMPANKQNDGARGAHRMRFGQIEKFGKETGTGKFKGSEEERN